MNAALLQFIEESQDPRLTRLSDRVVGELANQYDRAFAVGVECDLDKVVKIAQRMFVINGGHVDAIPHLIATCMP